VAVARLKPYRRCRISEAFVTILNDFFRQFPVVVMALLLSWYFVRYITQQHERELQSKNQEIARLLEEKNKEIDRLLEERKKYFQLFLKELQASLKKPSDADDDVPPASR